VYSSRFLDLAPILPVWCCAVDPLPSRHLIRLPQIEYEHSAERGLDVVDGEEFADFML
jgi:hypothetical protein